MKFTSNGSKMNAKKDANLKTINKGNHATDLSNKNLKNRRNLIQQQRANTSSNPKSVIKAKRSQQLKSYNQPQQNTQTYEDDQMNAFDANQHIKVHKNEKNRENQQYQSLIESSGQGFRRQKNKYFLQSEKYQGRRLDQEEEIEEEIDEEMINDEESQNSEEQLNEQSRSQLQQQNEDEQQQSEAENEIQQALSLLKEKRNTTSRIISSQLESINAEDETDLKNIIKSKSKTTQQEFQQAIQLKKLIDIFDRLVELRYGQQKELQDIKRYPKMDQQADVPKYPPLSHQLFTASRELENQMISNLSQYLKSYKSLAHKSGIVKKEGKEVIQKEEEENIQSQEQQKDNQDDTQIDLQGMIQAENVDNNDQDATPGRLNVDRIFTFIKENISKQTAAVEKELIKWSQKTSFLSTNTTQLNSLLMQTPIGQAKKVLSNWQRMAHKCQQKRGQQLFKILFESQDNIHQLSDPQIYDDYDLFIELEKYYLEKLNDENEDGEFLQSATMKYLKNRQANQLNHEKKHKDVDRKASKNRKIRYNVHTKLLNFMPSCPENVIETRDEIVRNMFNCNAKINDEAIEGNAGRYNYRGERDEADFIEVE